MNANLKYSFGTLTIYDNYMVAVMNEGITISDELNDIIEGVAQDYFPIKPFVYITHRKNSYAVDPRVYLKTSKIENLMGFAVVSGRKIVIDNSEVEKLFLQKPFKIFIELDDAFKWANMLCKNNIDESFI